MHRSIAALVLLLPLAVAGGRAALAQDLEDLVRRSKHSVVALKIYDGLGREIGTGSGFFIDPEGLVVTNHHVIEEGARVEAVLADQRTLPVPGYLAVDETNDLAVLRVATPAAVPPLFLADSSTVREGQRIVVLGNPRGLSFTTSDGIISAVRADGELPSGVQVPLIQISAPISPGSSGSPVMNLEGLVVGVAVSQFLDGQNLNFAVPSQAVRELLDTVDAGAEPRPFGGGLARVKKPSFVRNLVISVVAFGFLFAAFRYLR